MKTLGEKLRERREELDLTLRDVAETLGISYQAVQNWEADKSEPKPARWARLAQILQVDPLFFLVKKDDQEPFPYEEEAAALPAHSEDRAAFIYSRVAKELGFEGLQYFSEGAFKHVRPPGWQEFLSCEIDDTELYNKAKVELKRVARVFRKR